MTIKTKIAWRTVRLGDVATDVRDLYQPTKEEHLPYIGLEHIEQQTLRLLGVGDSRDVQSIKKRFKNGDVLFGSLRVYFRKVIRSKIDGVCSTDITVLRPKNAQLDPMFLFYLVGNNQFIDRATGQGEGTRMPRAGWSVISDFDIEIPKEIWEQKRIAGILSTFDEKIENNNRIIKALEEMAQTIFKERFDVSPEALPRGWKVNNVLEIVKRIPVGKKYENKTALPVGKVPILDQGQSGYIGFHNEEPGVIASIDEPAIVFTNHTCYYRLITYPFSAIQNVLPYVGAGGYSTLFVYYLTRDKIKMQEYKGHWPEFEQQEFVVPPTALAEEFSSLIKPMVQKIVESENENQKLTAMRDLLLPRLMSGEIRV